MTSGQRYARVVLALWLIAMPALAQSSAGQALSEMEADRARAVQISNQSGASMETAQAIVQAQREEAEQAATRENEAANRQFFREHAARPSLPEKLSPEERQELERQAAEYDAIQAAGDAERAGRNEEALADIQQIQGIDRDVNLLKLKARLHLRLRQYDAAVEDYNKLLALANDLPDPSGHKGSIAQVMILRARVWEASGDYQRAEEGLNDAARTGGAYLDPYLMQVERAQLYLNAAQWQKAIEQLTIAMQRFAGADRYAKRGLAYLAAGDKGNAKADLDRAIAAKTQYAPAWMAHAALAAGAGQTQIALDDCDYLINTLTPRDPWAHMVKGNFYSTVLHDRPKAAAEYGLALQLDPKLKEAADMRAQAMEGPQ